MDKLIALKSLSLTGRRWEWPEPSAPDVELHASHGLPHWLGGVLSRRGVVGHDAVGRYLKLSLAQLDDPMHMADMPAAVARLQAALQLSEPMVVYGDYDVDGVCSASILVEFLRAVGARVEFYIPDRRGEGYGLNQAAVTELCGRTKLLITVDCGITAHQEIAAAQARGTDVVVVDHHQVEATLPQALACLNPHRPDCPYPFKNMCAAGVAFMLVIALRRALRDSGAFKSRPEPDVRHLLDMVAVATVADMVPMNGTNRVLVAAGLRRLRDAPRPGLLALCKVAKVDLTRISATDLGFRLGPRINARGRMSQAALAVELMLTQDPAAAATMAETLDAANLTRRQVERDTVDAAIGQVQAQRLLDDAALVVHHPDWHPGVLGLVASRLVSRFHRPALVIGEGGKGSARSIEGLNLHAALQAVKSHLLRFGGHPAAAGVTVEPQCIPALRQALAQEVHRRLGAPPFVPVLRPDLEVEGHMLNLDTVAAVQKLAPFGQANPEPLFVARNLPVVHRRLVGDSHLKLRLGDGADAIGFGMGDLMADLPPQVDAAFYLERNEYNGRASVQLRLQDLRGC